MHELGIASSALDAALARAQEARAVRIVEITLRVGELSGVDPGALRFALESLLPGTPAEGAALRIDSVAAQCHCESCGQDFAPGEEWVFVCPSCGGTRTTVRQGRELDLVGLEVN